MLPDKKLYCTVRQLDPGGGGINVARVITRLGQSVTAIYPSGGTAGHLLNQLLAKEKVDACAIPVGQATRENISLTEEATQKQYRFVMPGEPLNTNEWEACMTTLNQLQHVQYIVVSGSVPDHAPKHLLWQLAGIARLKKARLVVDTSGDTLRKAVQAGAWLIKPNLAELAALAGKKELNEFQAMEEARKLIMEGQCSIVVVSMDARGALLVTSTACYRAIPPVVKPKSSVGAGDSMVAGLVHSLSIDRSLEEALQMGVACGTAAIIKEGTSLCEEEDVYRILNHIRTFPVHLMD